MNKQKWVGLQNERWNCGKQQKATSAQDTTAYSKYKVLPQTSDVEVLHHRLISRTLCSCWRVFSWLYPSGFASRTHPVGHQAPKCARGLTLLALEIHIPLYPLTTSPSASGQQSVRIANDPNLHMLVKKKNHAA